MTKKKNFIRTDKMLSNGHIETIVATEELYAGQFVNLGKLLDHDVVAYTKATVATARPDAIVVPVYKDRGYPDFDVTLESVRVGEATRARYFVKGDVISINKELVEGTPNEDDKLTIGTNGLGFKKHNGGSDVAIGQLIGKETLPNVGEVYVIRFL